MRGEATTIPVSVTDGWIANTSFMFVPAHIVEGRYGQTSGHTAEVREQQTLTVMMNPHEVF